MAFGYDTDGNELLNYGLEIYRTERETRQAELDAAAAAARAREAEARAAQAGNGMTWLKKPAFRIGLIVVAGLLLVAVVVRLFLPRRKAS